MGPETFDGVASSLASRGPAAALELMIRELDRHGPPRALLDALLLKARHEIGLPPIQDGKFSELPEPLRGQFEDRYVAAIRQVGSKLLDAGDVPGAWPYFRAIGEKGPVATAIEAFRDRDAPAETTGALIDIAFNQGAHPRRGFELILEHYGTCSAITAFEHLPQDDAARLPCIARLVATVHEQLVASLRADIARHGQPLPPEGASISSLIEGRPWLFDEDNYHIDVSHLSAVVRMAFWATDRDVLGQAIELTDYGRRLSERHRYPGDPPFENTYEDISSYLRALRGEGLDQAIAHLTQAARDAEPGESLPAQVLVRLLEHTGRLDEAIDASAQWLADVPESAQVACSTLPELCARAGRLDRLAQIARDRGDLVHYTAALLQKG